MPWYLAMLAIVPLIALPLLNGGQIDSKKMRVWVVMYVASLATFISGHPLWFLLIDTVAAALVLRKPRGAVQRLIGGIFLIMVFMNGGFYCAELLFRSPSHSLYIETMHHMGWAQWFILFAGSGYDALGNFGFVRSWHADDGDREDAFARSSE